MPKQNSSCFRPRVSALMASVNLDVEYKRALGQYMYYRNPDGHDVRVIDFIGGFGAGIFGHNNPELKSVLLKSIHADKPFNAQASYRAGAAKVAEKLCEIMSEKFDERFISIFGNTGTEAVEIALKHAELCHIQKVRETLTKLNHRFYEKITAVEKGELELSPDFTDKYNQYFGRSERSLDLRNAWNSIKDSNERSLLKRPYFLSLKSAFHGKTTGAVQLTFNCKYREAFTRIGPDVKFVEPENSQDINRAIEECTIDYISPALDEKGRLTLTRIPYTNISGFFVEPIQGEGGVHILSKDYMRHCRDYATKYGFPLILDEIQCGMGRTGSFFYSEQQGVIGDYYLLSKSLGASYGKISVVLVREKLYNSDFDLMHSSTFAEDDYSTAVSLRGMELLTDSPEMIDEIHERGIYLFERLNKLKARYPEVIREVRGAGLMIGLELDVEHPASPLIGCLVDQNMLGWVIAGFMLQKFQIRIAPTLSNSNTLRLQPPACITEEDCDFLCVGLDALCSILSRGNSYALTEFLLPPSTSKPENEALIKSYRAAYSQPANVPDDIHHVGFIGHFAQAADISKWDQGLEGFSEQQAAKLLDRLYPMADLSKFKPLVIESPTGKKVCLHFIGLFADSNVTARYLRAKRPNIIHSKIEQGVRYAEEIGCNVVGLGGHTSIITRNAKNLKPQSIGLTTGNSLTVGMSVEATREAATQKGISLETCCFACIGATGNIAQTYNEIISEYAPKMILIGRVGSEPRLKICAEKIYYAAYESICQQSVTELEGIAREIVNTEVVNALRRKLVNVGESSIGEYLFESLGEELHERTPIQITTDMKELTKANIIATASSSADVILHPGMIEQSPSVICDIAVPRDTDPEAFKQRPDITVFQGGVVKLPLNADFQIEGLPLEQGITFACISETLLLGLEGHSAHFSYGNINRKQVKTIMQIANKHGFKLARLKTENAY